MKKVILLTLFFSFLSSSAVFAHTGLENATPAEDDVVTEEMQEIVLEFNTELEQASSFTVKDEAGQEVPLSIKVAGQTMTGTLGAAVANDVYTVNWKIIGADGHPIEGMYTFTLDISEDSGSSGTGEEAEEATDEETSDQESAEEPIDENSADQNAIEQPADENLTDQEETTNAPYVMVIVLLVLAVIAGGTLMWVSSRRGS